MKLKNNFALLLPVLLLVSCGSDDGGNTFGVNNKSESLSYDFTYNNCPTHEQKFSSNAEMCAGLQNETLNNHCAQNLRRDHFEQHCPGQVFTPQSVETTSQDEGPLLEETQTEPVRTEGSATGSPTTQSESVQPTESSPVESGDKIDGDVQIRTLTSGQSTLFLFKNPSEDAGQSVIVCIGDELKAEKVLEHSQMGGMILAKGSSAIVKTDQSASFQDGSKMKKPYLQVNCR